MSGYDYSTWCGNFFPGNIGSVLIWGAVILLIVYLANRIFKSQTHNPPESTRDRIDSHAILMIRFARGEISQEEFIKMKQIISQL